MGLNVSFECKFLRLFTLLHFSLSTVWQSQIQVICSDFICKWHSHWWSQSCLWCYHPPAQVLTIIKSGHCRIAAPSSKGAGSVTEGYNESQRSDPRQIQQQPVLRLSSSRSKTLSSGVRRHFWLRLRPLWPTRVTTFRITTQLRNIGHQLRAK